MRPAGAMLRSATYILHEALPVVKPIYAFFAKAIKWMPLRPVCTVEIPLRETARLLNRTSALKGIYVIVQLYFCASSSLIYRVSASCQLGSLEKPASTSFSFDMRELYGRAALDGYSDDGMGLILAFLPPSFMMAAAKSLQAQMPSFVACYTPDFSVSIISHRSDARS